MAEGKIAFAGSQPKFSSPSGKRKEHKKRIALNVFIMCVFQRKIHDFYISKNRGNNKLFNKVLNYENMFKCGQVFSVKVFPSIVIYNCNI